MEAKLKQIITEAAENDRLFTVDWASLPLPQQFISQERARTRAQAPLQTQLQTQLQHWPPPSQYPANSSYSPPDQLNSRKRRNDVEHEPNQKSITPPWRTRTLEDKMTKTPKGRADKIQGKKKKNSGIVESTSKLQADLEKRRQRFNLSHAHTTGRNSSSDDDSDQDLRSSGPVVGTCQDLEKGYFRLTRAPRPHEVRPQHVLERALDLLKKKWRQHADYNYICDQFKSMRQDLTVQHIKNSFTVDVYELHARIALEKGDLGEYNGCQTQLRALYSLKLGGHPAEFMAYRILYSIHTGNRTGLNEILAELTAAEKEEPAVRHALETRSSLTSGNHHRFFRLYLDVPNMGAYLMDMFVVRERLTALTKMCKA
jgi:SAC3 family protein LENG8/THP3